MVEIKNLTKKFGSNTVLDNISLTVRKGEILGFLGPNGAGKSTTMKIITSFWTPTAGTVEVGGFDVNENSLITRKKIGYLPETVPLYDDMRVYEYLRFVAAVRGLDKARLKPRLKEVTEVCGLRKVIRQPIEELSKGYRQRVGLAQAIMHDPEILILDEPTTGLDPNQIVEIRGLIKELGREKTVIFSTHILSEVSATCDRAVIINNGRIVGEGRPDELAAKAGGKEVVYLKIKGPRGEIVEKLKSLEKVIEVTVKDAENADIFGYEVAAEPGVDLREPIFAAVMAAGWNILEFSKKSVSLEDVFRELTK